MTKHVDHEVNRRFHSVLVMGKPPSYIALDSVMFPLYKKEMTMNRRKFCLQAGALAAAPFAAGCGNRLPDGRALVANPDQRSSYTMGLLDEISSLGPRPVGSDASERCAEILMRELARSCPTVFLDGFVFDRWELVGEPEFTVGDTRIEAFPGHGTAGTPPGGITGVLRAHDEKNIPFVVVAGDGSIGAYVTSGHERAVPLPFYSFNRKVDCPLHINVGTRDLPALDRAERERTPVRVTAETVFHPGTTAHNAVGTIPGERPEEILFIAHHDTVYNTVGANDNTASAIAMIMLAHAFSGKRPPMTLTFCATTGEEYDKIGAIQYANRRRTEGTFGTIEYLINFDSLTWGPNVSVKTTDTGLFDMIRAGNDDIAVAGDVIHVDGDGFDLDGRPFRDEGIRACYINTRGYETVSVWHRPNDTPDSVPLECVERGFLLFSSAVRRIMRG